MRKRKGQKDILLIAISSFILTVAWIGFNIYHHVVTTTISEDLQLKIQPIEPNFDQATLQQLKNRQVIEPAFDTKAAPTQPETETTDESSPSLTPPSPSSIPTSSPPQPSQSAITPTSTQQP